MLSRRRLSIAIGPALLTALAALATTPLTRAAEPAPASTLWSWPEPWIVSHHDTAGENGISPLVTDRPGFTEATETVGAGRLQLESGYTYNYDGSQGRRDDHSFPELLLRLGLLEDWLEFRIAWNYASTRIGESTGTASTRGAQDLYLGAKVALTEQSGWLPAVTLMPHMTVPSGSDDYSADRILPGINLLYSWEWTDSLSLGGSTVAKRGTDETGEFIDMAQSVCISYGLTAAVGMYAEYFVLVPHGSDAPDIGVEHYLDAGFTFLLTPDLQFDFWGGTGLNDRAVDLSLGTGIAIRF